MQRLNRVLNVPNAMLKCSRAAGGLRTSSLNRVLIVNAAAASNRAGYLSNGVFVRETAKFEASLGLLSKRCYASGSLPEHTKIVLPALSPTMEQGSLSTNMLFYRRFSHKISISSKKIIYLLLNL